MGTVTKAWAFLTALSLTLIVLGHAYGGREGLLFALILVLGVNSFVYFYEDRRVLSLFSGRQLEGQDSYGLQDIARRLSVKARIPAPAVVLLSSRAPQAGVVGRGITHGTIILTQGILEKLTRPEIEALMAYQIACIKNLNTLAFAVGSFVASLCLFVTETLDFGLRILIVEKKNPNTLISQFFTRLASPLIGLILRLSVRPNHYLAADNLAAQYIGDAKTLANVLWKLESYSQTLPLTVPLSTAHMFTVSPLTNATWTKYLVAQPQTSARVRSLIGYYPV
jgi:heat shock protein HtpX